MSLRKWLCCLHGLKKMKKNYPGGFLHCGQNCLFYKQSPAFGIAVCEEFVIISACTMATIITGNMLFWYICLLAFSLHFVAHIIQFFIIRKYIPAIVSTVLCLPYCVMAISAGQEQYSNVENALLGVLSLVICIANLCLMQIVTPRIYKWIKNKM